jgi:hypothetical protein
MRIWGTNTKKRTSAFVDRGMDSIGYGTVQSRVFPVFDSMRKDKNIYDERNGVII